MFALHAKPSPPTNPAKPSEIISPNIFSATITPYVSGFFVSHIICASMFVSHKEIPGYSFAISFASLNIIPEVSLSTFGFSQSVRLV